MMDFPDEFNSSRFNPENTGQAEGEETKTEEAAEQKGKEKTAANN